MINLFSPCSLRRLSCPYGLSGSHPWDAFSSSRNGRERKYSGGSRVLVSRGRG